MESNQNSSIEIIRYKIPSSSYEEFERAYLEAGKFLQFSPYCNGYGVIKGSDEPDHYIVTIYWTSVNDHLQKFRGSDYFPDFFKLVKPFFSFIQEMKHYEAPFIKWERIADE